MLASFSPSGAYLPGTTGYAGSNATGYTAQLGFSLAINGQGDNWVTSDAGSVAEFSSNGSSVGVYSDPVSGGGGLTTGALGSSYQTAIDGAGGVWITSANDIVKLNRSGAFLSGNNGITGFGLNKPNGLALDQSGNLWVANAGANNILEFNNAGTSASTFADGGLTNPSHVVLDGAGSVWISNNNSNSVTAISSSGTVLSGTTGYQGGGLNAVAGIAVDGSGNVWAANPTAGYITQLLGAAVPVITPISAGLPLIPTTDGSSNLGTRP